MDQVWLKNFRCFRDKQTVRLTPLTLLVGENSTGKTSFMALIRALWDAAYLHATPDFKESPYDLGSFEEIVHYRGGKSGRVDNFEAGILVRRGHQQGRQERPYLVDVMFARQGTVPVPARWRLARGDVWTEERLESDSSRSIHYGTTNGEWYRIRPARDPFVLGSRAEILGSAILDPIFDPFRGFDTDLPDADLIRVRLFCVDGPKMSASGMTRPT